MDNRPVGVFDSGSGGLPAAGALRERLPNENIIYLGDTGHMPYGGRSKEELIAIARRNTDFLKSFSVKAVLVACGTISASLPEVISADAETPVFGVMYPAVKAALRASKTGRIAVAATERAIASGAFASAIKAERADANVISAACPKFAPMTEAGHFSKDDPFVAETVREYLQPVAEFKADTLILGCTHYSLLKDAIADFLGPGVQQADAGEAAAEELAKFLRERDMLSARLEPGRESFYHTGGGPELFANFAEIFFKRNITADLEYIDLPQTRSAL
ncbi:MAG: glutamate racemase [Oscillospiraceae bacterium]|nr:glutamate racemase [Oscillospiraceae bacterium]